MSIKLTELAFCAGCAAKLRAEVLMDVINPFGSVFSQDDYPELLIGLEKADDAAVLKLNDEQALVFNVNGTGAPGTQWPEPRTGLIRPRLNWEIESKGE